MVDALCVFRRFWRVFSCVMLALAVLTYRAYAAAARPSQALSKTVRLHVLYIVFFNSYTYDLCSTQEDSLVCCSFV